jgi:hypothetical protein
MRIILSSLIGAQLSLGLVGLATAATATFTGDAAADFAGITTEIVSELTPDVGIPENQPGDPTAPPGTISGWDVESVYFNRDTATDELQIGIEFFVIGGDADGDGDPSNSSPWMVANGGIDIPDLGASESICIALDFNRDGTYEIVAGVPGENIAVTPFEVATYNNIPFVNPGGNFGAELVGAGYYNGTPTASAHDFEIGIYGISQLMVGPCFDFQVFAGSYLDDGIGEDLVFGTACLPDDGTAQAATPHSLDLINAYPNPFNPVTTLEYTLQETGMANLSIYNMQGQLVETLVEGLTAAGPQSVQFEANNLSSGIYFARLQSDQGVKTSRLVLMK